MNNLKVIAIGAGMGGLTAAIAMKQVGFDVEVYDRVRELRPAGAGISLWSNGVKVLNRLGLGQEIASIGGPMHRMSYLTKTGDVLNDFSLQPIVEAVGQCPYPVARTDLQRMLLTAVGPDTVRLNSNCVAVEQDADSVTAIFADGRRVTGDVLVAADGTHSAIRNHVVGRAIERQYAGYVNWNGLVAANDRLAPRHSWVIYAGDGQRASLMPVGGDRFYFFFDVPLAKEAEPLGDVREELSHYFRGWADPVQHLIETLDPKRSNRVPIHYIEPLPAFANGRIALLGDAAHSTSPDLGQGGCQAIEDAWVLANSLISTNVGVVDALTRYEAARQERTADVTRKALKRARMIHGYDPARTQRWYEELANEDGSAITEAIASLILQGPLH
ncbi:MAG: FAD-dependent urate hydroxylase HpxO [Cyanobacteria bacterium P01_E01_bin.45]